MVSLSLLVRATTLIASLTSAAAASSHYVAVEKLHHVPDGWIQGPAAPPSKLMTFHIAIAHDKPDEFEQKVLDISTPGHSSYGQHMARDEVSDFVRPSDHTMERVLSWLGSEGVPAKAIKTHGNWMEATMHISQAEALMNTTFYRFTHRESDKHAVRTLQYSAPRGLAPYIETIQPTTHFGRAAAQIVKPTFEQFNAKFSELTANCTNTVTPDCLREQYGLYDTVGKPDPRNRLGISGYLDQYARYTDFEEFMHAYAPNQTYTDFDVVSINGGTNLQDSSANSLEASLDIQYAISLASDSLATYYTTGGRGPFVPEGDQSEDDDFMNEPYLKQLTYFVNLSDEELPAVLSTSYGEDEQSVPDSYAKATCGLFAQLGARGVSVIFSSGDSGVGSSCVSNDGRNRTTFQPIFPASCPFVTAVGGTYGSNPEKAIDFSGGGFSEKFERPAYQNATVGRYLKSLGGKWRGLYNPRGRGFPDVAAQAQNFLIVDHGQTLKIGGTSASAPVFAAIVSRLNAARLKEDKPRLGFLNPWLYSLNQTGFTDIVDGRSVGCTGENGIEVPHASWNATPGWDPATGLGTPFFNTLVKVAKQL